MEPFGENPPKYPKDRVRNFALQTYKELVWVQKSHQAAMRAAKIVLANWDNGIKEGIGRDFPDTDLDLGLLALQYIVRHPKEMATLAACSTTKIDVEDAKRNGFYERVQETLQEGRDDVVFVLDRNDAN